MIKSIDTATPQSIALYQSKVGSIGYPAIIARPDTSFASSQLSQYLRNPSEQHHDAVDQVIRYLVSHKYYALKLQAPQSGKPAFEIYSDSAFADNTDRTSSYGYVIRLFGGTIDWKAAKQDKVTTSSTEAELHALVVAAKEAFWWKRLFQEIDLAVGQTTTINSDNLQTIRLMTAETPQINTKLRHVDIAQCWLRQGIKDNDFNINYVETSSMIADGMTKSLPPQKHEEFLRQIGLVDLSKLNIKASSSEASDTANNTNSSSRRGEAQNGGTTAVSN